MRAARGAVLAAALALVVASGHIAYASGKGDPPPDIDVDHGNGHPGNTGGGGGGGGGAHAPVCVWQDATSQQIDATVRNSGTGGQIVREQAADPGIQVLVCDGVYDGRTWRTKPRPITPQELAAIAYVQLQRNLPAPAVHTTPGQGTASIATIPVFVWIDADQWQPLSFTETDPNGSGLSVTATATPSTMTFTPGDGTATVDCPGPALPYDPDDGDGNPLAQATAPGHCSHAYDLVTRNVDRSAVPGRPDGWPAEVAVRWTVAWRATDGATGTLNPVTKRTGFDRPVTEVQVLVTA
jgi:hypothetical protein